MTEKLMVDGCELRLSLFPPGSVPMDTYIALKPEYDKPENYVEHTWYEDPYSTGDVQEHRVRIIKASVPEEWTEKRVKFNEDWIVQAHAVHPDGRDRACSFMIDGGVSEETARERLMSEAKRMTEVLNDNRHCT